MNNPEGMQLAKGQHSPAEVGQSEDDDTMLARLKGEYAVIKEREREKATSEKDQIVAMLKEEDASQVTEQATGGEMSRDIKQGHVVLVEIEQEDGKSYYALRYMD